MLPNTINVAIQSGTDFIQEFTVTNNDMSPKDITGATIYAEIAKSERAMNVNKSSAGTGGFFYRSIPFQTKIVDGVAGVYQISLNPELSAKLFPGKYAYSVVMKDTTGGTKELVNGLAFVNRAFGYEPTNVTGSASEFGSVQEYYNIG